MFKKLIAKLALFIFVSLNLTLIANAANDQEAIATLGKALNDIESNPCITNEEEKEAGFITIIEEPLDIKDDETTNPDIKYRSCYRNTFIFQIPIPKRVETDPQKYQTKVVPFFSKECSKNAQNLVQQYNEPYHPQFTCQAVQVIISTGGTAVIYAYIGLVYRWAASLVGVVAVTVIILSGIQIAASGGDPEAISKGKTRIIQSLAGLAVLFLSALILNTINPNFFTL